MEAELQECARLMRRLLFGFPMVAMTFRSPSLAASPISVAFVTISRLKTLDCAQRDLPRDTATSTESTTETPRSLVKHRGLLCPLRR